MVSDLASPRFLYCHQPFFLLHLGLGIHLPLLTHRPNKLERGLRNEPHGPNFSFYKLEIKFAQDYSDGQQEPCQTEASLFPRLNL